jgi:hypothetical protein
MPTGAQILRLTQANNKPPLIVDHNSRRESFDRHFARCTFKEGDVVVFKKPKRNKITGHIDTIINDFRAVEHWGEGGVPRYIEVIVKKIEPSTGEIKTFNVWTTESKLTFTGKRI